MSTNNILSEVESIFRNVFENETIVLTESTSAKDVHNWNSMNHILLITEIENHFDVTFELDDLIAINNVGDILAAVQSKRIYK